MTIGTGSLTVTDINIGSAVGSDSLNAEGTISASKLHAGTSGAIGLDIEGGAVIGEDLTVLGSTYVSGTIKMAGGDLTLGSGAVISSPTSTSSHTICFKVNVPSPSLTNCKGIVVSSKTTLRPG